MMRSRRHDDGGPLSAQGEQLLSRAVAEMRAAGRDDLADRVEEERHRSRDPRRTILVAGEFKKGKSSVINSLLKARVCPMDPVAATLVPIVVRHGPARSARVVHHQPADGDTSGAHDADPLVSTWITDAPQSEETISLRDVDALATDLDGGEARPEAMSIIIDLPRRLLESGIVFIDAPGLNGGLAASHASATLRTLARSDAMIFVTDASQELTASEVDVLRMAVRVNPNLMLALTKTDLYPMWRQVLELNRGHLARAVIDVPIFPLSAPLRRHALRSRDHGLDVASGYPALAAHIDDEILGATQQFGLRMAGRSAQLGLGQLRATMAAQYQALHDPVHADRLEAQLVVAELKAERLLSSSSDWQIRLIDSSGDRRSEIDRAWTRRYRALRDEVDDRIRRVDPADEWPELEAWIRQRANETSIEHVVDIREHIDAIVAEVTDVFAADLDDLDLYDNLPAPPNGQHAPEQPELQQWSWMEVSKALVRGWTGGASIPDKVQAALALLTVAIPATTPFAVASVALGVATAGLAVRKRRATQLEANRAAAARAAHDYIDDLSEITQKDSADAIGRAVSELREYLQVRSAEVVRTAQRNRESAARAFKADRATRTRKLEQLGADMARITALLAALDMLIDEPHVGDPSVTAGADA